jgi:hypothetical protein
MLAEAAYDGPSANGDGYLRRMSQDVDSGYQFLRIPKLSLRASQNPDNRPYTRPKESTPRPHTPPQRPVLVSCLQSTNTALWHCQV